MEADLRAERLADLLYAGRILEQAGMCLAADGNFSARIGGERVLLTRAGIEKRDLTERSFVEVEISDESPEYASSEWHLHRGLYVARENVACVLHVHAPYLTTYAAVGRVPPLALLAEAHKAVGEIVFVPFCRPGSRELGLRALEASSTAMVYLLANHGAVSVGTSVRDALHRLERSEFLARVAWQSAALGGGIQLSMQQIEQLDAASNRGVEPC